MYQDVGSVLSALISIFLSDALVALFALARDKVHIRGRNFLIVTQEPHRDPGLRMRRWLV